MNYFIIDTSAEKNYITLITGQDIPLVVDLPGRNITRYFPEVIDTMLIKKGLTIKDIQFIAVCRGPGMFTGIRIGVSVAKALAFANNIPLISFHSYELLPHGKGEIPISDARGGKIYAYIDDEITLFPLKELENKLPEGVKTLILRDKSFLDSYELPFLCIERTPDYRKKEKLWKSMISEENITKLDSLEIEYAFNP